MLAVHPLFAARQFEVFRDPFVEPQRDRGDDRMDVPVGRLVPEILGDPVLPGGEHRERGVGFHEKRPPHRETREAPRGELVVAAWLAEQVEMHRLVRHRQ